MIWQIVPLGRWVVVDLHVFGVKVVKHHVARHRVLLKVERSSVTQAKGPVVERTSNRLPDTGIHQPELNLWLREQGGFPTSQLASGLLALPRRGHQKEP